MAIEKLYLTDTFRVWAEKFNATIQASNTATANAEEAINKANEAIEKAEQAFNDSVKGDNITTIVNEERQVVAKDVAINGDTSDLASNRGQIGDAVAMNKVTEYDLNNFIKSGVYYFHAVNIPKNAPVEDDGICCVLTFGNMTIQYYYRNANDGSFINYFIRSKHSGNTWEEWREIITSYNKATESLFGIVQADNTTITVKNGVISAKAMETITDITVLNNDFNNLTDSGVYFIQTTQGITQNSPIDITAYWWVKVTAVGEEGYKNILQEARLHSTDSGGAAYSLARCKGENWGPWEYAYTQFAG